MKGVKLLIFVGLLLILAGCLQQNFSGIAPSPYPAPEFALINQFGEKASLSDFRGKVVVMSFMYTHCPDFCPVVTAKFTVAAKSLKSDEVVFIGITVDPERDTPEALKKYVEEKGLQGRMYFLTGKRSELERVWDLYNVYVNRSETNASGDVIDHTARVYVLDKEGRLRILYPGVDWYPKYLVQDVEKLLREEKFPYRLIYRVQES